MWDTLLPPESPFYRDALERMKREKEEREYIPLYAPEPLTKEEENEHK